VARWDLSRRSATPKTTTPRYGDEIVLSLADIRDARLVLARDMLELLVQQGETLPAPVRQELQSLHTGVAAWRLRRLP
jgi:hypothetical protein